jgi:Cu2+-exporting ATPase
LKKLGIREIAVMSSGGQAATEKIAREARIDNVHFQTTPEDQADIVKGYKQRGWRVAVVGYDAANTLALEQADVAISLGVSADSARHRSDVVLTSDDLNGLVEGIQLARSGLGVARQNILLTSIPNFVGLSLSLLNRAELLAATLMNNGSVIVAAVNGLRPLLDNPPPDDGDEAVVPA